MEASRHRRQGQGVNHAALPLKKKPALNSNLSPESPYGRLGNIKQKQQNKMTWILPNQLRTLAYAPGMAESTLDSNVASRILEQSVLVKSKRSRASYFLREWRRDNLMRLRSGVISSHSLGKVFEEKWTSSLEATLASHSQTRESDLEKMTHGISGHTSQMEFPECSQQFASLKTSRGIYRWDSTLCFSSFRDLVTAARSDYSARMKSVRRNKENESLSLECGTESASESSIKTWLRGKSGQREGVCANSTGSHQGHSIRMNWATPSTRGTQGPRGVAAQKRKGNPQDTLPNQLGPRVNPRWIETLMGLPIGWVMPNCVHPFNPAAMNSECSETELSQPVQQGLF